MSKALKELVTQIAEVYDLEEQLAKLEVAPPQEAQE